MRSIYHIVPVAAPRMTRRDKWANRPCVVKYFAYRDLLRSFGIVLPDAGWKLTFIVPMPDSWSAKKKQAMNGQPHQAQLDLDNLEKAFIDAVRPQDKGIWQINSEKRWGYDGRIILDIKPQEPGNS